MASADTTPRCSTSARAKPAIASSSALAAWPVRAAAMASADSPAPLPIRVCAQAVLAAIGLTGSQRNDLALGGIQAAGAQRFGQAEVAVERRRRVGQRGEQVRHHAELGFDGLECGSGSGVSGVDGQGAIWVMSISVVGEVQEHVGMIALCLVRYGT
jgi:hypothetical protein